MDKYDPLRIMPRRDCAAIVREAAYGCLCELRMDAPRMIAAAAAASSARIVQARPG